MDNKRILLICDDDTATVNEMQQVLTKNGFEVEVLTDATKLVERATRLDPGVLIANPDMKGFNASDFCKKVIQESKIPVILLVDKNSTARAQVGECEIEDVVIKPVDLGFLENIILKNISFNNQVK